MAKAKAELTAVQMEFSEYKARATKVLQTKEKVIADMRAGGGSSNAANAELIEAIRERETMREELGESRRETEQLRQDLQAMEEQQVEEQREEHHRRDEHVPAWRRHPSAPAPLPASPRGATPREGGNSPEERGKTGGGTAPGAVCSRATGDTRGMAARRL